MPVWAQGQVTTVPVIQPRVRNIVRVVTRPSVIESYERASIQSKLTAYIEKWNVDIGDKVRKGDVLASLFVPELLEDSATKQARVVLAKQRVKLARELVIGAEADLAVASPGERGPSALTKYQAQVDRWAAEVTLLQREVDRGVVDPKVLAESRAQWKSSTAALDSAKAAIATTEAETHPKQVAVKKAALDVQVARADLNVAVSEANRLRAWTSYLRTTPPFDGIVASAMPIRSIWCNPPPGPCRSTWSTVPTSSASSSGFPRTMPHMFTMGRKRACLFGHSAQRRSRGGSREPLGP